jgi:hypothetical protein
MEDHLERLYAYVKTLDFNFVGLETGFVYVSLGDFDVGFNTEFEENKKLPWLVYCFTPDGDLQLGSQRFREAEDVCAFFDKLSKVNWIC